MNLKAVIVFCILLIVCSVSSVTAANNDEFMIKDVINASYSVKYSIENMHKVPKTINISEVNVTSEQYLYLSTKCVVSLYNGKNEETKIKSFNVSSPINPQGACIQGTLSKMEYINIAKRIQSFVENNSRAPNYANSKLGKISYHTLLYLFANICILYDKEKKLPDYVTLTPIINVAIYNGTDALDESVNGIVQCLSTTNTEKFIVTFSKIDKITYDTLRDFDVLIMPGGISGRSYIKNENISEAAIKNFVYSGKGYIGICAGAFAASSLVVTEDDYYNGWGLARVTSQATSYIGNITVKITEIGKEILDLNGCLTLWFWNGPVMTGSTALATYLDRYSGNAIIVDNYGNGRVALLGPHPELNPQIPNIILNLIKWVSKCNENISKFSITITNKGSTPTTIKYYVSVYTDTINGSKIFYNEYSLTLNPGEKKVIILGDYPSSYAVSTTLILTNVKKSYVPINLQLKYSIGNCNPQIVEINKYIAPGTFVKVVRYTSRGNYVDIW